MAPSPDTKGSRRGLLVLLLAGAVLGTIAFRARERSYVTPSRPGAMAERIEGDVPPGHVVRTFLVEGVCCPGCGSKLHDALADVEGVRKLAVDPVTREVQILVEESVPPERLTAALTFDEYTAHLR